MTNIKELEMVVGDEIILKAKKLQDMKVKLIEQYRSKISNINLGLFQGKGMKYRINLNNLSKIEKGIYSWK